MSLNHSPSIVRDGLVLYYDMSNTQKSFRGKPTTNITPDLGIVQVQSVSCTYVGVEDGWKKYALGGTWTAGGYPYAFAVDGFTCTGEVTYSTGIYVKTNVAPKFAALFTGMNYVNAPMNDAGTSFSIVQPDGSIFVGRYGFQYTSTSGQNGYLISQPVINQVFDSAKDFLYIKSGQIEQNSFCTPFVAGTRSNTQAIVDLTGNNTLTATSLTYASDNTFSFNGSSNYATAGNASAIAAISGTSNVTVEAWVNLAGYGSSGYGVITHKGNPWAWLMENPSNKMQIRFALSVSGDVSCADSSTHALNTWYQFVGSYDGTNMRFYRNGALTNTVAASGTLGGTGIDMVIGNFSGAYFSNGKIPVVKVYNRTLSADEVKQNFQALRGRYGI